MFENKCHAYPYSCFAIALEKDCMPTMLFLQVWPRETYEFPPVVITTHVHYYLRGSTWIA